MDNDKHVEVRAGTGFVGLLTITFIVLKLIGKITWSWFWVLAPLWIYAAVIILFLIVFFIFVAFIRK